MPRRVAFVVAAVLGVSVAVLPAIAGSETTPTIDAVNIGGIYGQEHRWQPAQVTVAPGAAVTFRNATEVAHGVEWRSGLKPSCEEGAGKVPVGSTAAASGTNWSGSCSFSQGGTYSFYCTVHGAAMSGTIYVEAGAGTTVTTSTGTQPPPGGTTTSSTPTATTPGVLLAVPALQSLKLPAHQRGSSVQGSVSVSGAAAAGGARLEVDLLARRSSLAASGHGSGRVRVGRLVRSSLSAGSVHFAVALDRRARNALRRHRRLALTVTIRLTAAGGQAATLTRSVLETRR